MADRLFQLEQKLSKIKQKAQAGLSEAQAFEEEEVPQGNRLLALEQSLDLSREFGLSLSEVESELLNGEEDDRNGNSVMTMQMGQIDLTPGTALKPDDIRTILNNWNTQTNTQSFQKTQSLIDIINAALQQDKERIESDSINTAVLKGTLPDQWKLIASGKTYLVTLETNGNKNKLKVIPLPSSTSSPPPPSDSSSSSSNSSIAIVKIDENRAIEIINNLRKGVIPDDLLEQLNKQLKSQGKEELPSSLILLTHPPKESGVFRFLWSIYLTPSYYVHLTAEGNLELHDIYPKPTTNTTFPDTPSFSTRAGGSSSSSDSSSSSSESSATINGPYGNYKNEIIDDQEEKILNFLKIDRQNGFGEIYAVTRDYIIYGHPKPWPKDLIFTGKRSSHHQGWKLHIAVFPEDALKVLNVVLPIVQKRNLAHKVCYPLSDYTRGAEGTIWKYITIYTNLIPLNTNTYDSDFKAIVLELDSVLKSLQDGKKNKQTASFLGLQREHPAGDFLLGKTGMIGARYGAFGDLKHNGKPAIYQDKKTKILDDRSKPWPDF